MKIINNNINFRGYKNFIGCDYSVQNDSVHFISMNLQLDNKGTPDLDNFKQIQELMGHGEKSLEKDVVQCVYTKIGNDECLFFNDEPLYEGDELKKLSKKLPKQDFAKIEKAHLKAYSLFASITRRIMQNDLINRDKYISSTISQCLDSFKKFLKEPKEAFELLNSCMLKPPKPGLVARKINYGVDKAMRNYFK